MPARERHSLAIPALRNTIRITGQQRAMKLAVVDAAAIPITQDALRGLAKILFNVAMVCGGRLGQSRACRASFLRAVRRDEHARQPRAERQSLHLSPDLSQ